MAPASSGTKRSRTDTSANATATSTKKSSNTLRFDDGAVQFRQRIVVAILSHRPLLLRNIRSTESSASQGDDDDDDAPLLFGLQAHEASFLRLIDQMTNGSHIEINASGTQLLFKPGILLGGSIQHDCPLETLPTDNTNSLTPALNTVTSRSIGWYIEGILPLALFGKEPLSVAFTGITDGLCHMDPSCDYLQAAAVPLLRQFLGMSQTTEKDLLSPNLDPTVTIHTRGAAPLGGGRVTLFSPTVRSALRPLDWTEFGKLKRVRGTARTTKLVSSSLAARIAYATKGVLHQLLPDVWIHTDNHTVKQHQCGPSPSVSLLLSAESTTGVVLSAEVCLDTHATGGGSNAPPLRELPEDLGVRGALALLDEVRRGGCIDTGLQSLVLLLLCLTPEDVSRVRIGTLSPYTIESLRLFHTAFGVEFKCRPDEATKTIVLSCLGTGYKNMARAST